MTPQHEDWGFAKTSNNCWQVKHFLMLTSNSNQNWTFQRFKRIFFFIYPNRFNPSWDSPAGQLPLCRTNKSTKTKPTPQRRRPQHLKFKAPTCSRLWISFFHTKFWRMENASLLWQNNCLLTEMPFTVSTNFQPSLSLPPSFKCLNRVFFSFSITVASQQVVSTFQPAGCNCAHYLLPKMDNCHTCVWNIHFGFGLCFAHFQLVVFFFAFLQYFARLTAPLADRWLGINVRRRRSLTRVWWKVFFWLGGSLVHHCLGLWSNGDNGDDGLVHCIALQQWYALQ